VSLAGRHVVVTRPAGQAAHFATALAGHGAIPVLYPVLEIRDIDNVAPVLDAAIRLDELRPCRVRQPECNRKGAGSDPGSSQRGLPACGWPPWARVANGNWQRHGIRDVLSPPLRFDSEALLELPELTAVAGKRVIIFRGDGGREVLGDTLKARGAAIEYVTCYRRARPQLDPCTPAQIVGSRADSMR
jgi:uroporphyrinogen-III synthase